MRCLEPPKLMPDPKYQKKSKDAIFPSGERIKAKYFYEKLKNKGIILRSTEDGYKIKNMLRLTVGSKTDNIKFMKAAQSIFKR